MPTSLLRRHNRHDKNTDLRAVAAASSKHQMDDTDSPSSCNFPEMLARDLEISEVTFLAKNMTAGTPVRGLATTERSPLYLTIETPNHHVHWEDAASLSNECGLGVIDEQGYHSDSSSDDNGSPSEVASLTSDSGSDSLVEMEPPSVRRRARSTDTAATSLNAHCSWGKDEGLGLVKLEDSYQGQSWIDLDEEEDDDNIVAEPAQTASASLTTKQLDEPQVEVPEGSADALLSSSGFQKESSGNASLLPQQGRASGKLSSTNPSCDRPRTSSGLPNQERLQDLEGSPAYLPTKHASWHVSRGTQTRSLEKRNSEPAFTSTTLNRTSSFTHRFLTVQPYHVSPSKPQSRQAKSSTHPVNDETTGRASSDTGDTEHEPTTSGIVSVYVNMAPKSQEIDSAERKERLGQVTVPQTLTEEAMSSPTEQPLVNPLGMNPPDPLAVHDSQEAFDHLAAQASAAASKHDNSALSSDSSSIGPTNYRSKIVVTPPPRTSSLPAPSSSHRPRTPASPRVTMQLPARVFESLSSSVLNFPDTMLLTTALPIEMIRSYRKKSATSPTLNQALAQPDDDFSFPTPSHHRFNLTSLRGKRHTPPPPPTGPSPTPNPAANQTPEAGVMMKVFPRGSELHCESLYAHLIAYNYITSLRGEDAPHTDGASSATDPATDAMSGTTTTPPRLMPHHTNPDAAQSSLRVTRKASMLLGIGDETPMPCQANPTSKTGKVRALLRGKCREREEAGEMVPAEDESTTTGAPGKARTSRLVTEREVGDLQAGLLRCVGSLVAKARAGTAPRSDDFQVDREGCKTLDPYLLRALCEVVRGAEEKLGA